MEAPVAPEEKPPPPKADLQAEFAELKLGELMQRLRLKTFFFFSDSFLSQTPPATAVCAA